MDVFICWSGIRSKKFAEEVRKMLENVFEKRINVHISLDIEKGSFWFENLRKDLAGAKAGILCLTPESLNSEWIHFEAGVITKAIDYSCENSESHSGEGFASIFTYMLGIEPAELIGPLAMYQSTRAAGYLDSKKMMNALVDLVQATENGAVSDWETRFCDYWKKFQLALTEIPTLNLVDIYSGFEQLFKRKTFYEPVSDCLNQQWLARYDGAKETRLKLMEHQAIVKRTCGQYVSDVYEALITEIDFYAMNVSLLIGRESFEIDKTGHLEVNPEGVAVACERNRKRILGLVALLTDPKQAPVFEEAFKFDELKVYAEKEKLIHRLTAELNLDESLDETDCENDNRNDESTSLECKNNLSQAAYLKKRLEKKYCKCIDNLKSSTWAFDRIMYYKSRNEMSPPTLKEMLRLTKREWYRIRAIEEEESLMSFYYALGKLIETIEEADSKESEDNLSEFIRHSIRRIRAKYENKQCHVRDRLCELANLINLPAEAECLAERHEQP